MDYILFDLDGTLINPAEGITNSVKYALRKYGIDEQDTQSLYKFIGPPLVDSFMEHYGFDRQKAVKAVEYYREYYSVTGIFENELYDGISELLRELRLSGKKVILATSKPEVFAKQILERFGILEYFDFLAGATLSETRTQKDEVIAYAIEKCNINTENAVMVGDRCYDIDGAHAFGIKALGVLFGFGDKEELKKAGADIIVKNVAELKENLI